MTWNVSGIFRKRYSSFDEIGALVCNIEYSKYHHSWGIDCTYYGRSILKDIDTTLLFRDAENAINYIQERTKTK